MQNPLLTYTGYPKGPVVWPGLNRRSGFRGRKRRAPYSLPAKVTTLSNAITMRNKDFKYYDYNSNATVTTVTGIASLSNLTEGDGEQNRDGNHITIKSIEVKFSLTTDPADATNYTRVVIFMDKSAAGALPTDTFIFSGANYWQASRNDDNLQRFQILMDRIIPTNTNGVPNTTFYFKKTWPQGLKASFLDNSGTATAFGQNHVYLFYVSDSGLAGPVLYWNSRMRYLM